MKWSSPQQSDEWRRETMSHTDAQLARCGSQIALNHAANWLVTHLRKLRERPTCFIEAGVSRLLRTRVTHFSNVSQQQGLVGHRAGAPYNSDGGENHPKAQAEHIRLPARDWRKSYHRAAFKIKALWVYGKVSYQKKKKKHINEITCCKH